jgi:hypothetical protein
VEKAENKIKRGGQGNLKSRRPNKKNWCIEIVGSFCRFFFFETAAYIDRPQIQFPPPPSLYSSLVCATSTNG